MEKKPTLSKKGLYGYVIGCAIGAGMFVTLPSAISHTGRSVILAVLACSLVYFIAYWYTVSLSSLVPIGGADYGYVSFVSSPSMAGVYGLTNLFWLLSNCTYGTGAMEYISVFIPAIKPYIGIGAALLITLFMVIDYVGMDLGSKVEGFMTIALMIALAVFVAIGLTKVDATAFFNFSGGNEPFFTNGFVGFAKAMGLCIWVIGGIGGAAITFARDVEKPTRTIPRCIIFVSILITIVGGLVCYVCAGAVPVEQAAEGVSVVAEAVLPKWLFPLFIVAGPGFAPLSTLQTYLISYRESIVAHADDGFLPKIFTHRNKKGYPIYVGLLIWITSVIPCLTGLTIDTVATYTGVPAYVLLIYINIKLMKIPTQYPELWKKSAFRNWSMGLWKAVCTLAIICSAYLVYCYVADFGLLDLLYLALAVSAMFAWGFYRMKSGKADVKKIQAQKAEVVREAMEYASQAD